MATQAAQLEQWDREALLKLVGTLNGAPEKPDAYHVAQRLAQLKQRENENDVGELPNVAVSKLGDMWLLGDHRLRCGSSDSPDDIAALMGDEMGVLMATDPPYGVDYEGAKYNPKAKDWRAIEGDKVQGNDLRAWIGAMIGEWLPYTEMDAAFYFWTAAMEEGFAALQGIRDSGLHVQGQIIWAKNVFTLGQADYHWRHENCWYAFRKGEGHRWFGGRDQSTLWDVRKDSNAAYMHPMQKPVELYVRAIQNHTRQGELCLEPFSGSGTQLIACEQLGRRCAAMELDPRYVDVAVRRWERYTGRKASRAR